MKYSDDQPRDEHGRWTDGDGDNGSSDEEMVEEFFDDFDAEVAEELGLSVEDLQNLADWTSGPESTDRDYDELNRSRRESSDEQVAS